MASSCPAPLLRYLNAEIRSLSLKKAWITNARLQSWGPLLLILLYSLLRAGLPILLIPPLFQNGIPCACACVYVLLLLFSPSEHMSEYA